jgi:hypothetical protein
LEATDGNAPSSILSMVSIEWIIKLFKYGKQSYNNLSFEREANFGERKPTYLDKRKPYAWIKFLSE